MWAHGWSSPSAAAVRPADRARRAAHTASLARVCSVSGSSPKPPTLGLPYSSCRGTPVRRWHGCIGLARRSPAAAAHASSCVATPPGGRPPCSQWYVLSCSAYADTAAHRPKAERGMMVTRCIRCLAAWRAARQWLGCSMAGELLKRMPRAVAAGTTRRPAMFCGGGGGGGEGCCGDGCASCCGGSCCGGGGGGGAVAGTSPTRTSSTLSMFSFCPAASANVCMAARKLGMAASPSSSVCPSSANCTAVVRSSLSGSSRIPTPRCCSQDRSACAT